MSAKVLILGDSQAAGPSFKDPASPLASRANIGPWLEFLLEQQGREVKRVGKSGYRSSKLRDTAESLGLTSEVWDRVYILAGGNDPKGKAQEYEALLTGWQAPVTAVSLPPATLIGDKELGKQIFGIPEASYSPDYFFPGSAATREEKNEAYKQVAQALAKSGVAVDYVDVRLFELPDAEEQPSGVVFPVQRDGIHVEGLTARAIAEQVLNPPPSQLPLLAGGLVVGWLLSRLF